MTYKTAVTQFKLQTHVRHAWLIVHVIATDVEVAPSSHFET